MHYTQPNHHRRLRRSGSAFTLVEILFALAILLLVVGGAMSVLMGVLRSSRAISNALDVNARSRFVQERLLLDLRSITAVTNISSSMSSTEVSKIFANYSGTEVSNCFRSFTATIQEYNGSGTVAVTYSIVNDGTSPTGTPAKALVRTIGTKTQKVLTNLQDGCFTFYKRKKSTGTLESLTASAADMADTNAIRFAFLPQGRGPLIPGKNDPSCSAVVQLRYPSYK